MLDSIRWKLLAWNALILGSLVIAFGAIVWLSVRRSLYAAVDLDLSRHATSMSTGLTANTDGTFDLDLPQPEMEYFRQEGRTAPYYALWNSDGELIDASDPGKGIPVPAAAVTRSRDEFREASIAGPGGATVLVGRSMAEEQALLDSLRFIIAMSGVATLALTLAGGWFLTGRALAPIDRITRAAARVSESNLTERIGVVEMESELRKLAVTINAAFDRLQQAIGRQTRFTADASHELRTPLAVILSFADSSLSRTRTPEEYREALTTVRQAALRMKSLVDGLLTLARVDAGELTIRREPLDLDIIVQESCAMLTPLAREHGVQLNVETKSAGTTGDRDRLAEVVVNLVTNAIRYNRKGGSVDISLRAENDNAVITVSDTGIGIPAAEQANIFERFYRLDGARSRDSGGSGLGLPITRAIIDAHGGSIRVQSDGSSGSTFTVVLKKDG